MNLALLESFTGEPKLGSSNGILATKVQHATNPLDALRYVQAEHGVSAARQLWEIARLGRGRSKLQPTEYYSSGLYRRSMSWQEKTCYLGEASNYSFNYALQPRDLSTHRSMMHDKIFAAFVLQAMGYPTSNTLAVYGIDKRYGAFPQIGSREGLIAALANPPESGLFGKPVFSFQGIGSVSIIEREASGDLRLFDEQRTSPEALADEIMQKFPDGYILQERIHMHADLVAAMGGAVGSLRICTIHSESGPEVLYSVLRLPAKNTSIDCGYIAGTGVALIDTISGEVLRSSRDTFPYGGSSQSGSDASTQLVGKTLPTYDAAVELVLSAHRAFPDHGILGWDVVLTPQGPLINEINTNAGHPLWQRAADRGFLNRDHVARLAPVEAFIAAKLAAKKSKKA